MEGEEKHHESSDIDFVTMGMFIIGEPHRLFTSCPTFHNPSSSPHAPLPSFRFFPPGFPRLLLSLRTSSSRRNICFSLPMFDRAQRTSHVPNAKAACAGFPLILHR